MPGPITFPAILMTIDLLLRREISKTNEEKNLVVQVLRHYSLILDILENGIGIKETKESGRIS